MIAARTSLLPVFALVALYACLLAIGRSTWPAHDPALFSAVIAIDLTLTASLLVWWLGVRRAGWPRWTIGATLGLGLLIARTTLPDANVTSVLVGAWLVAEAVIVVFAIARARTVIRIARAHRGAGPIAALEAGLAAARVPRRLAGLIATDVVAVWLGITGWFRRAPHGDDRFTMHRENGMTAIVGVLLALIVVETVLVHVLVVAWWGALPAWILSGLSIYGALWIAAHLHALRLYPIQITCDSVIISVGINWRVSIPRSAILGVERIRALPAGALNAGIIEPNVALVFDQPIEVRGLFGKTRRPTTMALTVDEPERFVAGLALNHSAIASQAT